MPPKKDFAAFLKKNQKKGTKGPKTEEASQAEESETKADLKDEMNDKSKNTTVTKKQNNNSSDDEEEDELDLATKQKVSYGTVKENKDIAKKIDKNEELIGYGLDEKKEENKAQDKQPLTKKAAFGEGASFGRPTFGGAKKGGKTNFGGGDFSAGLDDIDNPQAQKTVTHKQAESEESKPERKAAVKPTFTGRMNLRGGPGANDNSSGVKTDYDFGVVYSTKRAEGEGGERPEGEDNNEQRRGQRKPRDHGTEFGKEKKEEEEDNDFQIVRDTTKRVKKTFAHNSDSDEESNNFGGRGGFRGARVQRGGERGGERFGDRGGERFGDRGGERGGDRGGERGSGGRGGFFKNSAKRTD